AESKDSNEYPEDISSVRLENISFRFAGRRPLIKNISLEIKKGEIVAIMGENGSGKSTLVEIIQKNYTPENGKIIVNNKFLLDDINLENWRKQIAVVPQQIHIFNTTVLENIAFEEAASKTNEVIAFLQESGFFKFFDSLPQSVLTLVGEEGINLSGGQKQIIAVARALYHRPEFLILDEATSAMDRQSELFLLNLILRIKKDIAVLFITHRLHVLKNMCDKIYILENGTITSSGDHSQLLSSTNLYSSYWNDLISQ
ncbi:MAG: ATP-binding cassette domain-containing protein, partial [Bacteroidota bacterium]